MWWWSALMGHGKSFSRGRRGVPGRVGVVILIVRRPGGVDSAVPPRPALRRATPREPAHDRAEALHANIIRPATPLLPRGRGDAVCPNLLQRPGLSRGTRRESSIFRASACGRSRSGAPLQQIRTRPRPDSPQESHPPRHGHTMSKGDPPGRIPAASPRRAPGTRPEDLRLLRPSPSTTLLHPPLYEKKERSGGRRDVAERKRRSRRPGAPPQTPAPARCPAGTVATQGSSRESTDGMPADARPAVRSCYHCHWFPLPYIPTRPYRNGSAP